MTGLTRFDYGSTHGWFARHYEDGQLMATWSVSVCRGFRGFPAIPKRSHY